MILVYGLGFWGQYFGFRF